MQVPLKKISSVHSLQLDAGANADIDILAGEVVQVPGYDGDLQWQPAEARKALLRADSFILPFVVLLFCFLQFDRTNIANALTDTLRRDINVGNTEINIAQTLFIVGFVITELPFNMISKVMGPERFLPITMFLWGVATFSQAFLKNAAGLCAVRFFIGALEGGYIPGMVLYISKYYTSQELASRYAIFWASNSVAGALGGPLSIGILSLRGKHGLKGWQWLFLIGMCTSRTPRLSSWANDVRRGYSDLLPRSRRLLLSSSWACEAQVLLRPIVQHLYTTTSLNHCHSCHPQRPNESP